MIAAPPPRPCSSRDAGFTLLEMVFAIVLSSLIVGVVAAALITALNVADSTTAQIGDSTDAGLISSFLIRDAQSAGATDPTTARRDTTLGVTTDGAAAGWSGCTKPTTFLIRFSWIDATDRTRPVVVYYSLDPTSGDLTRRLCKGGTTADVVLGSRLTSAVAACDTACAGSPTVVSLRLEGSGQRVPFSYTLRASLRDDIQVTPTSGNSPSVPLLALGARTTSPPCVNLALGGTGAITVRGSAFVEATCATSASISGDQSVLRQAGLGTTSSISGIIDPYARRTAPTETCASGGTNASTIGVSATRNSVVVYPQKVTIAVDTTFQPGRYVFCAGLDLVGGKTTGADVLFYVKGGTVKLDVAATADLTGRVSGVEANLLLWATGVPTIELAGGSRVSNFRGVIYAPTSTLVLSSVNAANLGGVVVKAVTTGGTGAARIGLPLPVVSVLPPVMPLGEVTVPYSTTLAATGGTLPSTWSATGLPAGLTMGANGVVSGTPTTAGTTTAIVTVVDATAQAASFDYAVTINAAVTVTWPALPSGEVGRPYPTTTMAASLGTQPYVWAATGLPAGMSINATTGVLSGTPTAAANPATIVVKVTDALGATATNSYTVVINPPLVATGPAALPVGQVAVAYPTTTLVASAGATPYVWSATGLPTGLALNPSTGVLSGTPTVAGTYAVLATVTDALGATSTKSYSLTVNTPFTVTWPPLPNGQVGVAFTTTTMAASGGTPPYSWSATGLPAGLTLGASTGTIAGTPTAAGVSTVAVTGRDAAGASVTGTYTITIVAPATTCPGTVSGWRGEYYDDVFPAGALVLCRDDAAVNFDWGSGSPAANLPSDNFSVRWTRTQSFAAGTYTFTMGSDDGTRLYVDGTLVLNNWSDQSYPGIPPSVAVPLTDGNHTIVMEYYERAGAARATLSWVNAVPPSCTGTATGWFGQYYSNMTLTAPPAACRDDAAINFNWAAGAPYAGLPTDAFSVRWTKTQTFTAGAYNFALGTDDGGRLSIDGVLVLDRWNDQGYPTPQPSVTRTLSAGPHTIVVEHYERGGDAAATLVITPVSAPTAPTLAFTALTNASWSGAGSNTVFYRSTAATGSFTTTASSTDTTYVVTGYGFPALGTNWTSTAGASPAVNTYSWTAPPGAPGTVNVTATSSAGVTSAGTPLTLVDDITAPAVGTLSYLDGTTASTSVTVNVTTGTDAGSGIATRLLQRQSATLSGSTCGTYGAFATLANGTNPPATVTDTVALGSCYRYQYVVVDNVGNASTTVSAAVLRVRKTYVATVSDTAGLINYWRLGDAAPAATTYLTEPFGGTTGNTLQSRSATWVKHAISSTDAVFTNNGRLRKGGGATATSGALYWSTASPASADYIVQADLYVASIVANDLIGVVGRLDTAATGGTFYAAVYDRNQQRWVLYRLLNGAQSPIATSDVVSLAAGSTYRVALEMTGSTIRLTVGGVQLLSATDTSITAAGKGGVVLGFGGASSSATTILTDSTGMHLDDVVVKSVPTTSTMVDSRGQNTGTYVNGPTLGVTGAITNDTNTAMTLDGVSDYASAARQISGDFSIELWLKTATGGIGTGSQWWDGAGLVDGEVGGSVNDFGLSMRSDGRIVAGVGNPDVSIVSTAGYKDGNWHHVVFTRTRASGALALYVDGVLAAPAGTGTTALLDAPPTITIGRLQTGGNFFAGSLDEVAIYNTVLTPAIVAAHDNAG